MKILKYVSFEAVAIILGICGLLKTVMPNENKVIKFTPTVAK